MAKRLLPNFELLFFCFFALLVLSGFSPKKKQGIVARIEFASKNGIYKGKPIEVFYHVQNTSNKTLYLSIKGNFVNMTGVFLQNISESISVAPKSSKSLGFSYQPTKEGFYKIHLKVLSGKATLAQQSLVAGYQIEKLRVPLTQPADFDTFWLKTLKELAQISPNFKVTKKDELCTKTYNMYAVEMQSLDNMTIRGWYRVPKWKKNVPVVLQVPPLGGSFQNPKSLEEQPLYGVPYDFAVFSLNIRGHGNSKDVIRMPNSFAYITHNIHDKHKYVYRGAVADCIRALDFISQRPEIDQNRIAIEGVSQGGGLSLIVAALDKRLKVCAVDVPFLSDFDNLTKHTDWVKNEINKYVRKHKNTTYPKALQHLRYFDTKNFAPKIQIPVLMSSGLQDRTCPPSTNFATFNHINSKFKEYCLYPYGRHGGGGETHRKLKFNWIRNWFGM